MVGLTRRPSCESRARESSARLRRTSPRAARVLLIIALFVPLATWSAVASASSAAPSAGAPPSSPPTKETPPASIPVPEVARQAEEVTKTIRDLDALLAPGPAIEGIERRLPDMSARIAAQTEVTTRQLDERPSGPTLDALTALWQTTRGELIGYLDLLTRKATDLEGALQRLTSLRETWSRTRADARTSRAPAPVIERIDSVLAAIDASVARLQRQRAATLVLQDRLAQEMGSCEGVLARIGTLRQGLARRLLARDRPPVWHVEAFRRDLADAPDRLRAVVVADIAQVRKGIHDQRPRLILQIVLFVGLALLMAGARHRAHEWSAEGDVSASLRVFDRPIAAAAILTLLTSGWFYSPPPPRPAMAMGQVLALLLAIRVMHQLASLRIRRGLYLFGAFFLTDLVRNYASVVPVLEQLIFLFEMLAGVVVLAWWLVWRRPRPGKVWDSVPEPSAGLRFGVYLVLFAFVVALMAGAAGFMSLGLLVGAGILGCGNIALVLYVGVSVGDALVAYILRVQPLRLLGMVERQRPLLERRAHGLLRGLAVTAWVIFSLRYLGFWSSAVALVQAALGAEFKRGALSISVGDALVFVLTVWAAFLLSRLVRFVLEEDVYPRVNLGRGLRQVFSTLLHYAVLLVGFLFALAALGVDLTKITILASAFGVGIGFGLQNVVNNFVSGFVLLFERRIDVGDAVQIGDVSGRMQQMGMRACTVRTWEGGEVIVPNATMISDKVTNWTLSDRRRRIDVPVGVAYGTAPDKVLEILVGVARANPHVLSDPAPVALFRGFGESALRFEMQCWTDRFDLAGQTQSDLTVALYTTLREAGIEIPLPQRDVRVRQE